MQDDKCRAPAEQVDHVMRLAEGGDQRDWDLLQSLCQPHHDAKTRRGRKAREDPSAMTLRFKTTYYCRHYGQKLGGQVPRLWPTTARAHQAQVLPVLTPNARAVRGPCRC